ncbi:MAG: hypothetical protein KF684_13305 [Phycisphaeraceae bacterium]|nr:hypothetical protein [Phycisphaeraceae bacterium]
MAPRSRVILACVIAVVGLIVAMRSLHRGAANPRGPEYVAVGFLPWSELSFSRIDVRDPKRQSNLRENIINSLVSQGITRNDAEKLTARFVERLAATLFPVSDGDLDAIRLGDGAVDLSRTSTVDLSPNMKPFARWHEQWHGRPISPEQVVVRRLPSLREDDLLPFLSAVLGRSPLNAMYPPPQPGAMILEIAVPVLLKRVPQVGGEEPVYWGVAYWFDESKRDWVPADAITYAGELSRGFFPAPF